MSRKGLFPALAFFLAIQTVTAAPVPTIAIRNVNVIDGTGSALQLDRTVIIRKDKIAAMGPAATMRIPPGSTVINGRGKFLLPGLWDMHVHLWNKDSQLPLFVAYGVTGVRDMGSDFGRTSAWRDSIEQGKSLGPHIVTCGTAVDGVTSNDPKLPVFRARTPAEARFVFDQLYEMNVDCIKVLSSLDREAFFALAEQARHWHLPLVGHLPASVTAWEAIDSRMASMEHLFGLWLPASAQDEKLTEQKQNAHGDPLILERIKKQAFDTFSPAKATLFFERSAKFDMRQTPTLTLRKRMALLGLDELTSDPRLKSVSAETRAGWTDPHQDLRQLSGEDVALMKREYTMCFELVRLMKRAGVAILAGTDTGDPYTIPGATLHDELELLVRAGLTPMEAIQSATSEPARFLGWDESLGYVKPGMLADLVLLDANPLEDIRNTQKIAAVFTRGTLLSKIRIAAILRGPAK